MKKRIVLMALASSLVLTSKAQIYAGDPSVRLPTRDLYGTEVMGMSLAHAEMAARVAAWRQQQYEYYSEQAVEAYNERHWSGVIQNVNSALGTNYYSGFHFYLRGYAYEQLGYLKQAKKDYKKGKRYGCHEAATALNSLKEKMKKK